MKHSLLFILLFILYAIDINAQAPGIQWQKSYGGSMDDGAFCIQKTPDGGYIILGNTSSNDGDVSGNHGGGDIWLVKIDSLGTIQWQKPIGGSSGDAALLLYQIPNGGYIIAGSTSSNNGDVLSSPHANDIWVVKLDSYGNIIWQKFYGGSGVEYFNSLQVTSDWGIIFVGGSYSIDGDVTGNHGGIDAWIVKLDYWGNIEWEKSLGGSDFDEFFDVKQTADGGYIAVGIAGSIDGDVTGNHGDIDCWVVKLNRYGALQWQKSFGGTLGDGGNSILQRSDGGYIVVGGTNSNDGDISMNHGGGDCWIVWLDASGAIQSQRSLGGSQGEYCTTAELTSDGGFILSILTESNDGDVTQNHGGVDCWIVKFDRAKNIQWQKSYGGSKDEYPTSIRQVTDSTYIFSGWTDSNNSDVSGNHGKTDFWIVKLGPVAGPLPVELLSFNATLNSSKTVDLFWSTASETNNDFFTIERSSDAENFESIKFIDGAGNSSSLINYNSEDVNPLKGISYYRLKQTDFDGKFKYSEIVSVNNSSHTFNIFPNPGDGEKINISFAGNRSEEINVSIYNTEGQTVYSKSIFNMKSLKNFDVIPDNKLPAGIYIIVVSDNFEMQMQKLAVK